MLGRDPQTMSDHRHAVSHQNKGIWPRAPWSLLDPVVYHICHRTAWQGSSGRGRTRHDVMFQLMIKMIKTFCPKKQETPEQTSQQCQSHT